MTNPTVPHKKSVVNDNRDNDKYAKYSQLLEQARLIREKHCDACGWVFFEGTKFCTGSGCENSPEHCARLYRADSRKWFADPGLFHGRSWGGFDGWTLDTERLVLVHHASPQVRNADDPETMYLAWIGDHEVDLERMTTSARLLDVIFQTHQWASKGEMVNLIEALDAVIEPQANLCCGGGDKQIWNPAEFLKGRFGRKS